jgi:hypothetical protein
VISTICLFLVLGGGTALAAFVVNSNSDVAPNTISGHKPPSGAHANIIAGSINSQDLAAGSIAPSNLNATARPHKLEYDLAAGVSGTTTTVSHLGVTGLCGATGPSLFVLLKNNTTAHGHAERAAHGPDRERRGRHSSHRGSVRRRRVRGHLGSPGRRGNEALASGNFDRVEGQIVFRTPGRVTTMDFHAFTAGPGNPRCEFYGTAVTSSLS